MLQVAEELGVKGSLVVTSATTEGAHVTKVDPPFSSNVITFRNNI
jgi:hypothetical protein